MSIVGDRPETGVRIEVERDAAGPPWRYAGEAVTPSTRVRIAATVAEDGAVSIRVDRDAPASLAEKARLLLRAAWKHSDAEHAPPPRRIVRWRADR